MKFFFLFLFVVSFFDKVYSQDEKISKGQNKQISSSLLDKKISVNIHEENLEYLIKVIHDTYRINFSYVSDIIPIRKFSLKMANTPLKEILNEVLDKTDIKYFEYKNQIVLKKEDRVETKIDSTAPLKPSIQKEDSAKVIQQFSKDTILGTPYNKKSKHINLKESNKQIENKKITSKEYKTYLKKSRNLENSGFTKIDSLEFDSLSQIEKNKIISFRTLNSKGDYIFKRFIITFFTTPEYSYRVLKSKTPDGEEIKKYRDALEKPMFGISLGSYFDYRVSSRFFIRLGCTFINLGEKGSKQHITTHRNFPFPPPPTYPSREIPPPTGVFSSYQVNSSPMKVEVKFENYKSSLTFLSFPILLGIELGKERFSFKIVTGLLPSFVLAKKNVNTNYNFSYSYNYIDHYSNGLYYWNLESKHDSKSDKIEYKQFNLGVMGNLDIAYKISKNWGFSLSPTLKIFTNSIFKENAPVVQKPFTLGLAWSIQYYFR